VSSGYWLHSGNRNSCQKHFGRAIAYEKLGEPVLARKDYELTCRLAQKGCEKLVQ